MNAFRTRRRAILVFFAALGTSAALAAPAQAVEVDACTANADDSTSRYAELLDHLSRGNGAALQTPPAVVACAQLTGGDAIHDGTQTNARGLAIGIGSIGGGSG